MTSSALPLAFRQEMEELWRDCGLNSSLAAFFASFDEAPSRGLLLNTSKLSLSQAAKLFPRTAGFVPIPWCANGLYIPPDFAAGQSVLYRAGLFYLQDPAAMLPCAAAQVRPGELVLDMCAAPGGKAVASSFALGNTGVLFANEISPKRALALSKNLELAASANSYVSVKDATELAAYFPQTFDLVLLDVPCSGSAMFRKDRKAGQNWEKYNNAQLLCCQYALLLEAAKLLKAGGRIVYSTCSFSFAENEAQIWRFLHENPEFTLRKIQLPEVAPGLYKEKSQEKLANCGRIWPHLSKAEGHFVAVLQHNCNAEPAPIRVASKLAAAKLLPAIPKTIAAAWHDFALQHLNLAAAALGGAAGDGILRLQGDKLYLLPSGLSMPPQLYYLKTGVFLGVVEQKRTKTIFKPAQALLLALPRGSWRYSIMLAATDPLLSKLLLGESLLLLQLEQLWQDGAIDAVAWAQIQSIPEAAYVVFGVEGWPLLWLKRQQNQFKNLFPPSWIRGI